MDHSGFDALSRFVSAAKLHPILVNFTAALVPVSVACDAAAKRLQGEQESSLRHTAWWCLLFATLVTPLTAISGWLFWMPDDNGSKGMAVHKWLGILLVVVLATLFLWRRSYKERRRPVSWSYLAFGLLVVAALVVQGYLGGEQVFSSM